ncbi:MAG: hypothetical protein CML06_20105 [Pseudomonadales bacterium]|nr:hypothetical protein [Pseudomonadales bacterium]
MGETLFAAPWLQGLGLVLATLLILTVMLDVFITVFSPNGAGPFTGFWTGCSWNLLLRMHDRRPIHRVLSHTGPALLFLTILFWYGLLTLGFWFIFSLYPGSVQQSPGPLPTSALDKLYFVSTTLSSLGYGDMLPNGFPWSVIGTLGTFISTLVLTISLSYVLAVLSAAIERRTLARNIAALGATPEAVIDNAHLNQHAGSSPLQSHLMTLSGQIHEQGFKQNAYPILKFFHPTSADSSLTCALLLLADTCFLLRMAHPDAQPSAGALRLVENAIDHFRQKNRL